MLHTPSMISMNQPSFQSAHHQQPKKSRSPSISASSVVTVQRNAPPAPSHAHAHAHAHALDYAPAQLPSDPSLLAINIPTSRISRSPSPSAGATLPAESQINDGVGNLNRWSQSTASSAGNLDSPRRKRASSGANNPSLWNRRKLSPSQPTSPNAYGEDWYSHSASDRSPGAPAHYYSSDQHRRNAPSLDKPLPPAIPLSTIQIPSTAVASPDDSDIMLTATSFTPSTAGLLTPLSYSGFEYFGNSSVVGAPKREGPATSRYDPPTSPGRPSHNSPRQPSHRHNPSSSVEDASYADRSPWRPRTKERRDGDKKTMLSKALEKANTAVLLDNATNYEGALEAYQDACRLLEYVMDRTNGSDDRRKLEAIRETYSIRVDELLQLQPATKPATEQKSLPPRPMSNESLEYSSTIDEAMPDDRDSAVIETATLTRIVDAPRQPSFMPRHSFLTDAIREVEGSSSGGFLGPLWEKSKSPLRESALSDRTARPHDQLEETYLPPPLTPHRSSSRASQNSHADEAPEPIAELPAADVPADLTREPEAGTSSDAVSWLDTIEESGSDVSSVHSHSSRQELHRRDISGPIDGTDLEFDAAFDAAVEAAYEEGFVPDSDAQITTSREVAPHIVESGAYTPAQGFDYTHDAGEDIDEEAEEERILDDITRDYIDHGFNFDMQSKSALPRQSDSSLLSRNTWQSSVASNRTTAGTSLSTADKSLASETKSDESQPDSANVDSASAALLPDLAFGQSSTRPLSVISEGARSVQDRRSTGPNFKQLKIETARKPLDQWSRTQLPAVSDENARDDVEDEKIVRDDGEGVKIVRDDEEGEKTNRPISEVPSLHHFEKRILSPRTARASVDSENTEEYPIDSAAPPDSADTLGSARSPRPRLFRKNRSTASLRDHNMLIAEEPSDTMLHTPLSASFMAPSIMNDGGLLTARRPYVTPSAGSYPALRDGHMAPAQIFDTSLGAISSPPLSPQSEDPMSPLPFEPCPESSLLRPFWLLRCIASTIIHPRGGFLTTRLFVPREVWQTRNVKLKYVEEKVANCDLLTAALGKLSNVDTYDADAVLEELQGFEEVMERVQTLMIKKLGSEVGVQGVGALFKDASTAEGGSAATSEGRDGPKTNSGKSYLQSWRKLRSKNSSAGTTGGGSFTTGVRVEKDSTTMASVPMTSFLPVEKRTAHRRELLQDAVLDGPLKEYTSSLARLCEAVQVLDQIARQVEDPGLKYSSPTHVGLELSTRHAAEFFGFYICRFALADLGLLLDKFVKRNTEWVIA